MDPVELVASVKRAHGLRERARALGREEAGALRRAQEVRRGRRAGRGARGPGERGARGAPGRGARRGAGRGAR
jgi:hypothetical protein